jgi:cation diffusion facilitator CzcD-associated flavoprotein CzcO
MSTETSPPDATVDAVVVGAGVLGLHQLYLLRESGFEAMLLEAGSGVGGTWYWNRYPECRFDSESYTYGYLFSDELFDEWQWKEHFAGQPETERYLNHMVDKFDLRRHIRFNTRVTSAVWDHGSGQWTIRGDNGTSIRARFLVAATGVLSIPFFPDVPGRESFQGEAYHTGLWPKDPVDFAGKRVAQIGTGSSGVQLVPAIAGEVESLTVYQRSANWCTPLNNRPITPEEQAELRANFQQIRDTLNTSQSGFLHVPHDRKASEDTREQRREHFEKVWNTPGFGTLICNYTDVLLDPEANAEFCEFIAEKIRSMVDDPETADKLIPKDERFGEKRPPFVTGYYEAYNRSNVSLIDLKETPIVRVTETGIETTDGLREFDMIIWATGFDFGTGALNRMGIRGRDGLALEDHWHDGPTTFIGTMTHGFPNLFFPGGPHGAAGNNPRYGGDQVEFVHDMLLHMREHGLDVVEVDESTEAAWTAMVDEYSKFSSFTDKSYFYGTNVPGKPRRFLLNPAGRPKLFEFINNCVDNGFQGLNFDSVTDAVSTGS